MQSHSATPQIARPAPTESAPYFAGYVNIAVSAMASQGIDDLVALLQAQPGQLRALLANTDQALGMYAYAPGKWTLSESLLHVADTERVFSYRALRVARGDQTPLPSFDQDAWVPRSGAMSRPLADILHEIDTVRAATVSLVRSLSDDALMATGVSSGAVVSTRALVWIIAGHFAHHVQVTAARYLPQSKTT